MFETMSSEVLLSCGILGVSALALASGLAMMRDPVRATRKIDLDAAVKNAPYHRLHNVLSSQHD